MTFWLEFLPIIIYILLIIVLIIGIIIGIKAILTLNKVEKIVEDMNEKFKTLNNFFHIIDYTTDKIALVTDKIVEKITGGLHKMLFSRKKKKRKESEEDV